MGNAASSCRSRRPKRTREDQRRETQSSGEKDEELLSILFSSGFAEPKLLGKAALLVSPSLTELLSPHENVWKSICLGKFGAGIEDIPAKIVKAKGGYCGLLSDMSKRSIVRRSRPKIPPPGITSEDITFFVQMNCGDAIVLSKAIPGTDLPQLADKTFVPDTHFDMYHRDPPMWGKSDDEDSDASDDDSPKTRMRPHYEKRPEAKYCAWEPGYWDPGGSWASTRSFEDLRRGEMRLQLPVPVALPEGMSLEAITSMSVHILRTTDNATVCLLDYPNDKVLLTNDTASNDYYDFWPDEDGQVEYDARLLAVPENHIALDFGDAGRALLGEVKDCRGAAMIQDLSLGLNVLGKERHTYEVNQEWEEYYPEPSRKDYFITHIGLWFGGKMIGLHESRISKDCYCGEKITNMHDSGLLSSKCLRSLWSKSDITMLHFLEHVKGLKEVDY